MQHMAVSTKWNVGKPMLFSIGILIELELKSAEQKTINIVQFQK
jgi:hypothetical protein